MNKKVFNADKTLISVNDEFWKCSLKAVLQKALTLTDEFICNNGSGFVLSVFCFAG